MARDESELRAAKNAYREASNIGNRQEEARWANVIGDIFKRRGEYVEALRWLRIDYEISVKHLPEKHLIPTCQSLGEIYLRLESFEEALNYQKKHLQLAKDIDDLIEQQRASTQLGRTYHEMFYRSEDDHDAVRNSKKYFKLAMKLAQTLKENPPCQKSGFFLKEFIDAHNNLGMLEMDLDNLDEAQQILLEGLKLCDDEEVKEDDDGRSRLHHNLGNLYIELRKWDNAKEHTERDILICKKICHPQGEAKGFINLGELHYRVQKYDDAIICYQRALDIARSMEDEDALVDQIIQNINTVKEAAKVLKELSKEEQKLKKLTRNAVLARGTPGERKCLLEQNASLDRLIEKSSMIFAWTKHLEFGKRKKRVATELCDKEKLGDSFLAIGESYQKLRNFDKAQKWYMKSWNLYRLIGNLEGQALAKINIGDVLDSAGDWPSALQAFEDGYRLAVQGNLPSVQISALDNMHYSNMIRFDNVEEARRLQQKILDLKSSINGGFKEKNPGNECCSETETEGCDISYTSSDSDISPKINLESSALTRSKGLTSVGELNDDLPLASVIKFCKRPSKKKTSQMDSRGKEPEVSGIPTEHCSQYLNKPVRSQCSVGRKRIRVVLSDDEDAYDEMDHSRERLSIHPVVDMDTSAEVKRRNVSTGPAGGIQDMSLLGAPKDGFSVCTAFHLEESTCSFGSASPVSPKFTVVNGMESRAFSCEKISSAANFVANGSKMDGAHVSGTSLPSQNGMDFLLQSSEGQFVNCITFKMGDNIIHVDASSCMNGDTLSFERMKAELACLYYLGLPEDNRSRGLLPIIRHFKHRGNVLKPFEFVEDFKDIFGRKGVIEVVIGGWVQKRLMKLYIDYCKKLSEAPNMKLLRKLYNLQVSEDEIIVSDCELQDLSVLPFLNALLEHKTIAILDMSHNLLGNETMEKLQQIFISSSQRYGGLTLDLHCNQFGPTALFQICECPVLFARLEVLDLSENRLTDSCASYLSTILENCKVLYSLNLEKCSITSRTIQKVADALNAGSVLSQLYIGKNNPISGNVMSNLLAKLATLKRFSELNLNGVKLSKPAVDSLCQLAKSSCLSRLMLGDTSIGTDGAIQLTEALTSRSQELVKLDLSHCGVISGDFMRLCTNITLMGDILELNLGGNPIGQEGTDSLVPLLTNPGCCLKALILNKCYLGLAGILRIIQAISENNSIEELVLSENVSIDKNTSENGLTAKLFLKSSKHLNLSAVPTEKSASIELRNSQQTLQAQNLDSNGLEAANSKGDEIEKDAILSGPNDSCASSGQPSEESEDSQLFQELSIAIGSAKNLQFLDLSNNGFSTEVAEMLYIAWSSSFRCNGLTQKHIEENIVHFSCEGKQCCGVKICCKRD